MLSKSSNISNFNDIMDNICWNWNGKTYKYIIQFKNINYFIDSLTLDLDADWSKCNMEQCSNIDCKCSPNRSDDCIEYILIYFA